MRRKIKLIWRRLLLAVVILTTAAWMIMTFYGIVRRIPSTLYFRARQSQRMDLGIPATGEVRAAFTAEKSEGESQCVTVDLSRPVTMRTGRQERYDMEVRLFGILPLKKVDIRVIDDRELIPMGIPIGMYMQSRGVLVVGLSQFETKDGKKVSPAQGLIKEGDYLLKLNGESIAGKEALAEMLQDVGGERVQITLERDGKEREVELLPVMDSCGKYKAGIWVRDNLQGVGTLTYLDCEGKFGALGHGIADVDTGTIMEVSGGTLYQTEIVNLRPGHRGSPGEMTGKIIYDDQFALGEIDRNTDRGVYGICNDAGRSLAMEEPLPIGLKQEIELGPAQVLCTLEDEVECFAVEITKVHLQQDNVNRGIELRVTDPELIRRTGGIVQGMSGSPILQNGKIIGAVTHVLVNSPERGYGIFIENMLEEGAS